MVVAAYDAVVGGPRYVSERVDCVGLQPSRTRHPQRQRSAGQPPRELVGQRSAAKASRLAVALSRRGQASVPPSALRGRWLLLGAASEHDSDLLFDAKRAARQRRPTDCCWSSVSSHAGTCTRPVSTRSSSPTAHTPSRLPARSGSAVRSKPSCEASRSAASPCRGSRRRPRAGLRDVRSRTLRRALGRQGMVAQAQHRPTVHGGSATAPRSSSTSPTPMSAPSHRTSTDGRFYYARVASVTDAGRPAGLQPARRHR